MCAASSFIFIEVARVFVFDPGSFQASIGALRENPEIVRSQAVSRIFQPHASTTLEYDVCLTELFWEVGLPGPASSPASTSVEFEKAMLCLGSSGVRAATGWGTLARPESELGAEWSTRCHGIAENDLCSQLVVQEPAQAGNSCQCPLSLLRVCKANACIW